jgi:hypothetical protein
MGFSESLNNGWKLTNSSFAVLKKNKQLIIFPIITGFSLLLVFGSFVTAMLAGTGWNLDALEPGNSGSGYYVLLFVYYVVNYFVIMFFNTALIHCARLYFKGEEADISKGINFSLKRIGVIFTWSVIAATVGTILRMIQDKAGLIGKIVVGLIGIVWSIGTFFVLPIIAYEDIGPIDAVKRSANLMKQKWGETLTATFSFGIVQFLALLAAALPVILIGVFINGVLAVVIGVLYVLTMLAVMSAVRTIFIAAVYETVNNRPVKEFEIDTLDGLFIRK